MIIPRHELEPSHQEATTHYERGDEEILAMLGIAHAVLEQRRSMQELNDTNIESGRPIISPLAVANKYPQSEKSKETVARSREAIAGTIQKPTRQSKLIIVVGPCSIHDPEAALEYAAHLEERRKKYEDYLDIVMRTYLEKPRTITGWEGFMEDPDLDGTYDKDKGYLESRRLLNEITSLGLPVSTELLNTSTPQYIDDLISWGAVGARTVESQLHRKLGSGVSFPVGFKNGTSGDIQIAIEAILASKQSHYMDGINMLNQPYRYKTRGNDFTHLILRGGKRGPNFGPKHIERARKMLTKHHLKPAIMVDASHANSNKDYRQQLPVVRSIAAQVASGDKSIVGALIESFLIEGRQEVIPDHKLVYGQSITDGCIGLKDTDEALEILANAVDKRRSL
jgi:3-deoxy-7-phosphoheptulonate synthase